MNTAVFLAENDADILDVLLSPDDVENNFENAMFHLKPRPSKKHRPDSTGTSRREEEGGGGGGGKEEVSSPMSTDVADIDVDVNDMNRFDNLAFLWMTPREFIVSSEPMLPPRLNLSHKMESGEVLCNQHVHINVASAPSFPHLTSKCTEVNVLSRELESY